MCWQPTWGLHSDTNHAMAAARVLGASMAPNLRPGSVPALAVVVVIVFVLVFEIVWISS